MSISITACRGYACAASRLAEAMTAAWSDEARAVEGRPDAQEEAVALFTMHAAKGLEWPIVIPVNTMTGVMAPDSAVIDRQTETFYCPVLGVVPEGYETARQAEKDSGPRNASGSGMSRHPRPRISSCPGSTHAIESADRSRRSVARDLPAWTSPPACRSRGRRRGRGQHPDARELRSRSRSHRGRADAVDLVRAQP